MANIDLIRNLNRQYGKESPIVEETRIFAINEAMDRDNIEKAISNSLASMGPTYAGYFDMGLPAEVALLFIDVCSFSTRFADFDGEDMAKFFDEYYDVVIPIIYKYGGEIDKIIGDGIVCVFGLPFLSGTLQEHIVKANDCARELIKATKGKDYSSKIAFHCGTINYFKNKTGLYKEFTMIGRPLTEIFRLESVSFDERINYFSDSYIRKYFEEVVVLSHASTTRISEWTHHSHLLPELKGISYQRYHSISLNE
jgi:class 3 adenylate cyclase